MEILMRDHLIKLFKVMYDRIVRDWIINTLICKMKSAYLKLAVCLSHVMTM